MCVSGRAAAQSALVDSHFLVAMQGRVLPLQTALGQKDLYLCRCPAKHPSEEANSESMQAFQVIHKSVLAPGQLILASCQRLGSRKGAYHADPLQHLILGPHVCRPFQNLLFDVNESGAFHHQLVRLNRRDWPASFLTGFMEKL